MLTLLFVASIKQRLVFIRNTSMNQKITTILLLGGAVALVGYFYLDSHGTRLSELQPKFGKDALAARFEYLSKQGTNSCGGGKDVVKSLADDGSMQGSCCGAMSLHSYEEQIEGLKKYTDYDIIPPDPYDVAVDWAKEMIAYSEAKILSPEQQAIYDAAMEMSEEGPCCCKCWHWYAYEGLAKKLIIDDNFSAEQIAEVWDLSDACGGEHSH